MVQVKRLPGEPKLASPALMVVFNYMLKGLLNKHGLSEFKFKDGVVDRIWLKGITGDLFLGILGPFLGAAQVALAVEKMNAMGVREALVVGCCGAVSEDLSIGEIFLPEAALSEEGVSRIYCGEQLVFLPHDGTLERIESYLNRARLPYKKGAIFSTDGVLRETRSKLEAYRRLGIKAVDMEVSAIFCVAKKLGIKVAAAFVVSDELYHEAWKPGFGSTAFKEMSQRMTQAIYQGVLGDLGDGD